MGDAECCCCSPSSPLCCCCCLTFSFCSRSFLLVIRVCLSPSMALLVALRSSTSCSRSASTRLRVIMVSSMSWTLWLSWDGEKRKDVYFTQPKLTVKPHKGKHNVTQTYWQFCATPRAAPCQHGHRPWHHLGTPDGGSVLVCLWCTAPLWTLWWWCHWC